MIMKGLSMSFLKGLSERSFSLFLDRDGVINERLTDDYVKSENEFVFIPGTLEAIKIFATFFKPIVVVTNQQGIGKGLMTTETLNLIHSGMIKEISSVGGRIDKVYFCGEKKSANSINRKPGIGMGLQAKKDFPQINFKNSIMVGDTKNDMIFGKRLNMKTILISEDQHLIKENSYLIDLRFNSLLEFAQHIIQINS